MPATYYTTLGTGIDPSLNHDVVVNLVVVIVAIEPPIVEGSVRGANALAGSLVVGLFCKSRRAAVALATLVATVAVWVGAKSTAAIAEADHVIYARAFRIGRVACRSGTGRHSCMHAGRQRCSCGRVILIMPCLTCDSHALPRSKTRPCMQQLAVFSHVVSLPAVPGHPTTDVVDIEGR